LPTALIVGLWCAPTDLSYQFFRGLYHHVVPVLNRLSATYSKVGDPKVFSSEQFPWSHMLEENWSEIRQELDEVMVYKEFIPSFVEVSKIQYKIDSKDGMWKTFFFSGPDNHWSEGNCRLCPVTCRLLHQVPGLQGSFFSILAAGKHIPRHRGMFKGSIRYHLALKVPQPRDRVRIAIDDKEYYWQEGQTLIFDDTNPHEVWNDADEDRVVLLLDIARPMYFPMNVVHSLLVKMYGFSSEMRDALQNQMHWEQHLQQKIMEQASNASTASE
jgi:beta-hydroxylase